MRPEVRARIAIAILPLILLPSAVIAWHWRTMPHLGAWHDDAVYWVSAKSLATGDGYRLLHLPAAPAQTKYPPLYPFLLSLVWRVAPSFPANAPCLMLLQWSMLPLLTALLWLSFRRMRFGVAVSAALTAVVAMCPMTTMFATTPLTELPFLIAVLACLLAIPEGRAPDLRRVFLAGLCAAASVMIRTNGIVLAAAIPLALWPTEPRMRLRRIVVFLAPVFTAFAGWELWCRQVRVSTSNDLLAYYTDYAGFYRRTFSLADLPHRVWINIDGLLTSVGRLVIWSTSDAVGYRELCWFLALLAIAGWLELWRKGHRAQAWFALLFSALLVLWNFPPDQRFCWPLLPFATAGLVAILSKVISRLPVEWATGKVSSRVAACVLVAMTMALPAAIVLFDIDAYRETFPRWIAQQREQSERMHPAWEWVAHNTTREATIAAYDDPLLYLYSSRQAISIAVLPSLVYDSGDRAQAAYVREKVREWEQSGITLAVTTPWDFRREFQDTAREAEFTELQTGWQPVWQHEGIIIWLPKAAAKQNGIGLALTSREDHDEKLVWNSSAECNAAGADCRAGGGSGR